MDIANKSISKFNKITEWSMRIHEGFFIGIYNIMPRIIHLSRSQGNRIGASHSHHVWEFNIILSGTMKFRWEDQSAVLKSGDVFFISPDALHSWQLLSPDFIILGLQTSIGFGGAELDFKQKLTDAMDRVNHHSHNNQNISGLAFEMIDLILNEHPYYREKSRILLQSIYIEIFSQLFPTGMEFDADLLDSEATMGMSGKRITEILEYFLNDNSGRVVKVSEICQRFRLSQCQLNRLCQRETGMTTSRYIMNGKVNMAKHLLKSTERMVKEIALTIGYPNVNYFCRLFKKTTGMTPEEYRNKNR